MLKPINQYDPVRRVATALALAVVCAAGAAHAAEVANAHCSVAVKYKNGLAERYVVTWSGDVSMRVWETGGPSVPLSGHMFDDRQCHWEISGSITRQVLMVNAVGQQFVSPALTHVYDKGQANEGANFRLLTLAGENCGQAEGRRNSDLANMKQKVVDDFTGTVATDFAKTQAEIKQDAQVIRVSEDQPKIAKANR